MDIFTGLGSFATFRNILLAILMLPLLTMAVLLPIYQYLSKNTKDLSQKPTVYFDHKTNRMTSRYEPFDSDWIVYLIVLVIIAILSGVLANYYNPSKYGTGKRNRDSEINSLDL